jgi:hypothetical protein
MGALRDFVADLLDSEGAAIEPVEPDGLDVLAPEPLRAAMGWPELARLGFGTQLPSGATPIGLEGDWLDRFGALLGDRGRFAERQLVLPAFVAPPSDPERRLDGTLDLRNAVWRLRDAKPAWTRCLLLAFRYTAISDERREGLIWLGFNAGTAAVLDDDIVGRLRQLLARDMEWRAPSASLSSRPPRAPPATRRCSRRGSGSITMSGAIWSLSCARCAAGSTATAAGCTSITTICARARRSGLPGCARLRAKRPSPTASASPCGWLQSSANMPPSSTICVTTTLCG